MVILAMAFTNVRKPPSKKLTKKMRVMWRVWFDFNDKRFVGPLRWWP